MFSSNEVPAVGVSIGIERVFALVEASTRAAAAAAGGRVREAETAVLVASVGKGLQAERMALAADLWAAGVPAEFGYKVRGGRGGGVGAAGERVEAPALTPPPRLLPLQANPNLKDQLRTADEAGIPFVALLGADEVAAGTVTLKDMGAGVEEAVPRGEVAAVVATNLATLGERSLVVKGRGAPPPA